MADLSLLPPSAVVEGDDLRIAGVSLRELAREFGTPAYVLDEDYLRARARQYVSSLTTRHPPRPRPPASRRPGPLPSQTQPGLLRGQGLPVGVGHRRAGRGGPGL
jgi:diaminopimelate decarboxylase